MKKRFWITDSTNEDIPNGARFQFIVDGVATNFYMNGVSLIKEPEDSFLYNDVKIIKNRNVESEEIDTIEQDALMEWFKIL